MKDSNPDREILDDLNNKVEENSKKIAKIKEEGLISQEDLKQQVSTSVNDYLDESLHSTYSSDDVVKTKLKEVIDSIRTSLHLDHHAKLTNMDSKLQALDSRFQQLEVELSTRSSMRRASQKSQQMTKSKDRRKQRNRAFYKAIVKPKTASTNEVDFYFTRMQALFESLQLALHDLKHHSSNNKDDSINYKS